MELSRERYDQLCKEADEEMKARNGHSFEIILKTRCIYCGRSPKAKGKCRGWFMTFINILYYKLEEEFKNGNHDGSERHLAKPRELEAKYGEVSGDSYARIEGLEGNAGNVLGIQDPQIL